MPCSRVDTLFRPLCVAHSAFVFDKRECQCDVSKRYRETEGEEHKRKKTYASIDVASSINATVTSPVAEIVTSACASVTVPLSDQQKQVRFFFVFFFFFLVCVRRACRFGR